MNQISADPLRHDFGYDFNYFLWTADTEVTLTNVPWDSNYRDAVWFDSNSDLNAYIDASDTANVRIANMVYAKANEPIQIDTPFNVASRYNYVRVYNPAQPVSGESFRGKLPDVPRYFYYFILDVRYINPNCTEIVVQLDVFQSWVRRAKFGRCYIERGHAGIANEDNFVNYGRDYLTIPEGIDTGSEYVTVAYKAEKVMDTYNYMPDRGYVGYGVLAFSTIDLAGPSGTKARPDQNAAKGSNIRGAAGQIPSGASAYYWETGADFFRFLQDFSDKPWITQGIMSIHLVPSLQRYMVREDFSGEPAKNAITGARQLPAIVFRRFAMYGSWRNAEEILNYIPARYRHLRKLFTFPYMMLELTTWTGSPLVLKPESWNSASATVMERIALMPPNQRISFMPMAYNSRNPAPANNYNKDGEYMDVATFLSGFPSIPIINNAAILAMANNARSMANQYANAQWSQQRALRGNQVSYDQATGAIAASQDQTALGIASDAASTGISNRAAQDQAILGLFGGIASGAGMGAFAGPGGAIAGGVGGLASGIMGSMGTNIQIGAANEQFSVRAAQAQGSTDIANRQAGYVRDSNKGLADWASRGDYEATIASLNAKAQDMSMIAPSTVSQFGGETMNLLNGDVELSLRVKMIDQAAISVVGEYWLRYGYAVRRFANLPPNLSVMSHFTYWKLTETYIESGAMPEIFKNALRGMLEKGITIYTKPEYVGTVDAGDNKPIPGYSLGSYTPPPWSPEEPEYPEPPTPNRKRKKMIVYSTSDGEGALHALAGTSPGTEANFITTRSSVRLAAFLDATGQTAAVPLTLEEFNELQDRYLSPVSTLEFTEGV